MTTAQYYKLSAEEIFEDIIQVEDEQMVLIKGMKLAVHPHVYPSDRFRTTNFVLDNIRPLLANKTVCDMGCGLGVVGQFALMHNAESVVSSDINPYAVNNAKANKILHGYTHRQLSIYQSNCFDNVPRQTFDLVVWNMPYHTENIKVKDPLQYAFHDPEFASLNKFLKQLPDYTHSGSETLIAFSNKGDIAGIEKIFTDFELDWDLWKITNTDQEYDNRIYRIRH